MAAKLEGPEAAGPASPVRARRRESTRPPEEKQAEEV